MNFTLGCEKIALVGIFGCVTAEDSRCVRLTVIQYKVRQYSVLRDPPPAGGFLKPAPLSCCWVAITKRLVDSLGVRALICK